MGYTHTTASCDVESPQSSIRAHNRNKADIVGKDVDVIRWRDGNSNLELLIMGKIK